MNKQFFISVCLLTSLIALVSLSIPAQSATVAYWRFDEGPANAQVPHGGLGGGVFYPAIQDYSPNGFHLATWDLGNYAYRSAVAVPSIPQTGQTNSFSVQNTNGGPAMFTKTADAITTIQPAAFTIEATFKLENGNHRTIVGRDSRGSDPVTVGNAALYLQAMPNNVLAIKFCDVQGFWHEAISPAAAFTSFAYPNSGTAPWYTIAAVSDGSTLSLYLKNLTAGTDYALIAQTDMTTDASTDRSLTMGTGDGGDWNAGDWSVGRGLWDGGHADRAWGFIDEVRISSHAIAPAHFLYAPRINAWSPTPVDGAFGVGTVVGETITVDLGWNTGMTAADLTQVNTAIGKHYLYMSDDQRTSTDPNLYYVTEIAAAGATGSTSVAGLLFDGQYLWRIDESVNGSTLSDPNTIQGPMWTFNTRLQVPVITTEPVGQLVAPGQTAVLTIAVDSVSEVTYQWYKSVDNANNTIDDDVAVGSNSATLTLTNVQAAANEGYYYCVATNQSLAKDTSNTAFVEIKRLKAWYAFENDITDSAENNDGTAIKADPNIPFAYSAGMVGQAIGLNGVEEAVEIPRSIQDSFTIQLWVKTAAVGGLTDWWNGKGLVDGEMPGGVNDFGTVLLGGKFGFGVGNPNITIASTTTINDSEWHFCVATRDHLTGQMRLYVDGLQEATGTSGVGRKDAPTALRIGSLETANNFLAGQIDEVKLYNYVVDGMTIATEYTGLSGESVCFARPTYDYTGDCRVTLDDFALFAGQWLDCAVVPDCLP